MDENPYKPTGDSIEPPKGPTRFQAVAWGAKFGGKVGVGIGGAIALCAMAIRIWQTEGKGPANDTAVNIVMAIPGVLIFGLVGVAIGAAVGFVCRYRPETRIENRE